MCGANPEPNRKEQNDEDPLLAPVAQMHTDGPVLGNSGLHMLGMPLWPATEGHVMIAPQLSWVRSSLCESGQCVEVAFVGDKVYVGRNRSPRVIYDLDEWNTFLAGAKAGEFDRPPVVESLEERLARRLKPGDAGYDPFYDASDAELSAMVPPFEGARRAAV